MKKTHFEGAYFKPGITVASELNSTLKRRTSKYFVSKKCEYGFVVTILDGFL